MKKGSFLLALIIAITLCSCSQSQSVPDYTINDIASTSGYLLICGNDGRISVTKDIKVWQTHVIDENVNFYDITSNNGLFYILGKDKASGSILVSYSPADGKSQTIKCDETIRKIEAANGQLFAFTRKTIKASKDGVEWIKISHPPIYDEATGQYLYVPECIVYDGSHYILSGAGNFIAISSDLSSWTFVQDDPHGTVCTFGSASNGKQTVLVGDHFFIGIKDEGDSWSFDENVNELEKIDDYITLCLYDVATDGKKFIAVGHRGLILVWNGDVWDVSDSGTRYPLKKIVWDGKVFLVLSEAGMLLSSDGLVWSAVK